MIETLNMATTFLPLLALLPTLTTAASGLSYNALAQTPQMGWDTYNSYAYSYNETTITQNANLLVNLGLRDLGYNVVIFDDAMTELNRSSNGSLIENRSKFPNGLKNLADSLHNKGLQFGVYSSAGAFTCGGWPASLGHEAQDAAWWASLGADYLKYDNCYNEGQSGTPQISERRYRNMSDALKATGRNFVYSLCNWGDDKPWEWTSTIANSARISGDIQDSYDQPTTSCPCGPDEYYCQIPGYGCSVMNILGKASFITSKNQPGYWNDLDMLEIGNRGMTYDEYKTHMSLWAAIKSPLIMGNKLYDLAPRDYAILINPAVLAINQDPNGSAIQRRLVERENIPRDRWGFGELQVWSGSLFGGDQVVAFINGANETRTMAYSLIDVFGGIRTNENAMKAWDLYDVWGNQTVMPESVARLVLGGNATVGGVDGGKWYYNATRSSWAQGLARNESLLLGTPAGRVMAGGVISASVPRHGVAMWRLKEVKGGGNKRRDEL